MVENIFYHHKLVAHNHMLHFIGYLILFIELKICRQKDGCVKVH